jgi:AAA domain
MAGLIEPARPLRVLLIENEGPRAEFRRKLRAKLAATSRRLDGRIAVLAAPWATVTLADEQHRRAIASEIVKHEADILVLGPLVSAGEFPTGGTPDEIRRFEEHVADLRRLVERPFALLLIHHENRAGQPSGAWERFPDTLLHVTPQGNGRTRAFWQKARWASSLHGTSTTLLWADGESFMVEAKPELTEESMREALLAAVLANPGGSWTKIRDARDSDGEKLVRGNLTELQALRDALLAERILLNRAPTEGRFELYLADDPDATRSGARTALERPTFPPPASEDETIRSPVPYVSRNGVGNGTDRSEPETLNVVSAWAADLPENERAIALDLKNLLDARIRDSNRPAFEVDSMAVRAPDMRTREAEVDDDELEHWRQLVAGDLGAGEVEQA